jgi:hypothetical protein
MDIDRLTLRPGNLVETKENALIMQSLADQVTAFGRDVVVVFTEDLNANIVCQPLTMLKAKGYKRTEQSCNASITHHQ